MVVEPSPAPPGPLTRWQRVRLVLKVIEVRLRFVAVLVVTALVIGQWDTIRNRWDKWRRGPSLVAVDAGPGIEFFCPMHPNVVRASLDPDGRVPRCPICGMPLATRKKGAAPPLPPDVVGRVQLSPERIALAGVRTEEVVYRPLRHTIDALGNVIYDESRLSRIVARASGYLEKLYVSETFVNVEEGEPLAEIYSPELYTAVQELGVTLRAGGSPDLVEGAREKLRLLGVGDQEIDEIAKAGKPHARLVIRSPQHGHVIHRAVVNGAHVNVGDTLFEIADLSKVWIEADVYERDIPFLHEGQPIWATVEAFPGRVFAGKVSLVHPHLQSETRTDQVRFVLDNPHHDLRPGMFASVRIETPLTWIEPFKSGVAARLAASATAHALFTCPKHPDLVADAPGKCPRCGTALVSKEVEPGKRLSWWCPMHPEITSEAPGAVCELCGGMKLVPRVVPAPREGEVLAVPEPAVIDTGTRRVVYIEREPGLFEGVLVELGPRAGRYYPVIRGLAAGDRVVATGAFLVDAETRLNPAAGSTYVGASSGPARHEETAPTASPTPAAPGPTGTAPVTTVTAGSAPAPLASPAAPAPNANPDDAIDASSWTLSDEDRALALRQRRCPISGDVLGGMGTPKKIVLGGRTFFLCCGGCEEDARKDPAKTLRKLDELLSKGAAGGEKSR